MKRRKKTDTSRKADVVSYPLWDNYRYMFFLMRQVSGRGIFFIFAANIVLRAAVPFLGMALPSAVIAFLTGPYSPGRMLGLICGYVLLLQGISLLQSRSDFARQKQLFLFRLKAGLDFQKICLEADGEFLESESGQEKMSAAEMNYFKGSDIGMEAFVSQTLDAAVSLCGMIVYSVIIAQSSAVFMLMLLALTGIVAFAYAWSGKKANGIQQESSKNWQRFYYLRGEAIALANGKDIRLFRMKDWFSKAFEQITERAVKLTGREWSCYFAAGAVEKTVALIRDGIIYGYLIAQMVQGRIGVSRFLLYVGIVAGFGNWMTSLVTALQNITKNSGWVSRDRDFKESDAPKAGETEPVRSPGVMHELCLEKVCFRYPGNDADTIQDLSLTIRPGEKLAVVGANGAGKTTLVKLLCGLYRPTSGRILMDGQDISEIARTEYFKEFAVVFQDVFAFAFSLEDNVSCKPAELLDEKRLEDCLKNAGLWERVQGLEHGAKTSMNKDLDEQGVTLSGGELQKLMLARALYKDAPTVILDEPTAALDPLAESAMYEKYHELTAKRTSVFISHRLSSTRFCDRILFLENGRAGEMGTHEALMAGGGAYARMFEAQAQYYKEKGEA